MLLKQRKIDYLNDKPIHVLVSIIAPLALAFVVQLFTSALSNSIYSHYVGKDAFSVPGYLGVSIAFFTTIPGGITSAAWIKSARFFQSDDKEEAQKHFMRGLYTIFLISLSVATTLFLLMNPIMRMVHVPEEIYPAAKRYYLSYVLTYFPIPICSFLLTIVNGTSSPTRLFGINLFSIFSSISVAYIVLGLFGGGITGVAILSSCDCIVRMVLYLILLWKDGLFKNFRKDALRPDFAQMVSIIRYGFLIVLQSIIVNIGSLAISIQTNRHLSVDSISVMSVGLPFFGISGHFATAMTMFCPKNYAAHRHDRLKKFFSLSLTTILVYAFVCFLLYAFLGRWYFSTLFDDPQIIAWGAQFWFWDGLGFIALAPIYIIRYFLDSVGQSKLSLLSGIGELVGNFLCVFWIIPCYGAVGRYMAYTVGRLIASALLVIAYLLARKRIYKPIYQTK